MSFVRYVGRVKIPSPTNESQRSPAYIMSEKEETVPLYKGKSKQDVGKNIITLEHEGYKPKQAIAIALNTARKSGDHTPKREHHSKEHHQYKRHKENR